MLKIRMQRTGRRNQAAYRIVVIDSHAAPKSGNFIEKIGYYDPLVKKREMNAQRIMYWLDHGALLSDTVYNFCVTDGVLEGKKRNALPKHTPQKKEQEESEDVSAEAQDTTSTEGETPDDAPETQEDKTQDGEDKDTVTEETPAEKTEATEGPPGAEPEVAKN